MENKKPKTIDEFFIEKYNKLEEEIEVLEERQKEFIEINYNLGEERDKWEQKYYELINKLKEDFKPDIGKQIGNHETYFTFRRNFIYENNKEKDKYYIDIFNLKEEGEEEYDK